VKRSFLIILFIAITGFCHAQRSEVGALMGASFYLGDLNSIPFRDAKFAGGLIYRYNFTPRVALKANILFGKIAATDDKNHGIKKIRDERGEFIIDEYGNYSYLWDYRDRKLSFSSPISEISAQLELNFFNLYNVGHKNQISPYLFGGIAFFSFNPQAEYNGELFNLQPIGTEGQGHFGGKEKKYALTGFAIPFGIGFKANIGKFVCVGAEWGLRFTFTDYLDDVGGLYYDFNNNETIPANSKEIIMNLADPTGNRPPNSQRYSTTKTDWYSFAGIIITVRIGNEDRICDIKTNVKLRHKRKEKL